MHELEACCEIGLVKRPTPIGLSFQRRQSHDSYATVESSLSPESLDDIKMDRRECFGGGGDEQDDDGYNKVEPSESPTIDDAVQATPQKSSEWHSDDISNHVVSPIDYPTRDGASTAPESSEIVKRNEPMTPQLKTGGIGSTSAARATLKKTALKATMPSLRCVQRDAEPQRARLSSDRLTKRESRRQRSRELVEQQRSQESDDDDSLATALLLFDGQVRPESAPFATETGRTNNSSSVVTGECEPIVEPRRSQSLRPSRRRHKAVASIVMSTKTPTDTVELQPQRGCHDLDCMSYNLSESGVLCLGEFTIGPNGTDEGANARALSLREEFLSLDQLGRGACGCVQRALHVPSGIIVAVKRIAIDDEKRLKQIVPELRAFHGLKSPTGLAARLRDGLVARVSGSTEVRAKASSVQPSPADAQPKPVHSRHSSKTAAPGSRSIVDFFDAYVDPDSNSLCLVLEFMNAGSLDDLRRRSLVDGVCVDERILARVAFCVVSALRYIHSRRELHRDIKPSNILLNLRGEVKVSDYGCHRHLDEGTSFATTFTGTLQYMSPERIAGQFYSYPSDIWSLGVSLLATALGENPYAKHKGYWDIAHAIKDLPLPQLNPDKFSQDCCHFVYSCLQKDPLKRPSAMELQQHPFFCIGRRINISSLIARIGTPTSDRQHLCTMISALCDSPRAGLSANGLTRDRNFLRNISAQLCVPIENLEAAYADIARQRRNATTRKKGQSSAGLSMPMRSNVHQLKLSASPSVSPLDDVLASTIMPEIDVTNRTSQTKSDAALSKTRDPLAKTTQTTYLKPSPVFRSDRHDVAAHCDTASSRVAARKLKKFRGYE